MHALTAPPAFLPASDARRPRIGRAILGTMLVAGLFEIFALGAKEFRPLGDHAPWMDDPFDVVTSFAIFFLPIIGALSAVRLALCRRFEPLPLGRLADLVHGCIVLLVIAMAIAASDWIAVIVGADRGSWSPVTLELVVTLGVLTAGLVFAAAGLLGEIRRTPTFYHTDPTAPDWLADATDLAGRMSRRLGPLHPTAMSLVQTIDRRAWVWVRRRPVSSAVLAAVGFAALFAVGAFREDYSPPLLVFVLVVAWCGMFAFLVAAGAYLGLVRSPARLPGARRRLLDSTLVGCACVPIALAFRDFLWSLIVSSSSVASIADLDRLLVLAAVAAFAVTLAFETLARIHEPAQAT